MVPFCRSSQPPRDEGSDQDSNSRFKLNADPDPDPAPHQSDGNLRPLVYRTWPTGLHFEPPGLHNKRYDPPRFSLSL